MGRIILLAFILVLINGCTIPTKFNYYHEEPSEFAEFYATGYASISSQTGKNKTEKMLRAITASKLNAYKELTAQIHGQRIESQSKFNDLKMKDTNLSSSVDGLIRGARVVKSYPVNDDIYATELKLDYKDLYLLYNSNTLPILIINE